MTNEALTTETAQQPISPPTQDLTATILAAREALRHAPTSIGLAAVEAAERWCRGEATLDEVRATSAAAWSAAFKGSDAEGAALMAAGHAAWACSEDAAVARARARQWAALAAGYAAGGDLIACQAGAADARAARQAVLKLLDGLFCHL